MPHFAPSSTREFPTDATVATLVRLAAAQLSGDDPRRDAELLLQHALDVDRAWLFSHAGDVPGMEAVQQFGRLVERRVAGEPLAYVVGHAGFWTLDLRVTPDTLIPRPETELLVELALSRLPADQPLRIADLGTGSGAIALALASERPKAAVVATDMSGKALAVARENARRNGVPGVVFREGDWFVPLGTECFDLIASNPPYIAEGDAHLGRGDLRFEPLSALSSGADGLNAISVLCEGAPGHLVEGGWLLIEHGYDQGDAVRSLLGSAGFVEVETRQDLEQRDRVSLGRKKGGSPPA
ncbi:peptide chain release factor N(5)-glutamine methyltransferase [Xanthomonadaceae bacterium JHOS43]|nr:peptide chain release factor N(5)-glutamine methyltransferase [Xanthomonadaceae bacterium JHOS43]MCX7563817.1 peptide chain release factor N(5)-glutamine methyltransferase [Xanthomonadaceae bacterium XH05]